MRPDPVEKPLGTQGCLFKVFLNISTAGVVTIMKLDIFYQDFRLTPSYSKTAHGVNPLSFTVTSKNMKHFKD